MRAVPWFLSCKEFLADQRQHGGIGKMKDHAAKAEDHETPAAHEHPETGGLFVRRGRAIVKATGAVVIDRIGVDGEDAHDRKQSHAGQEIEDDDWPPLPGANPRKRRCKRVAA